MYCEKWYYLNRTLKISFHYTLTKILENESLEKLSAYISMSIYQSIEDIGLLFTLLHIIY